MNKLRAVILAGLLLAGCAGQETVSPEASAPAAPAAATPAAAPASPFPAQTPAQAAAPAPGGSGVLDASKLPAFDGQSLAIPDPKKDPLRGVTTLDHTVPPDDLWVRIRRGFAMPDIDNKLVKNQMAYYVARPDYLQRVFDRSRLYLYHIVEAVEKRGMPTEIALLPIVESAFNPMAYSRAHASGIWQFIPGTGKRYDLQQNYWYDGRRDIVDSTAAALDYLEKLYKMHGDWQLALASYNWGEGAVGRAIAKNRAAGKPTDYLSLKMPKETQNYLPKLQAIKNIIANPQPFGIELDPIPNQPYFAEYTGLRDIDVRLAAELAEMQVDEFIALNPGFSRPLIRAAVTPRIVLPADKVDVFHDNLAKLEGDEALVSWKTYHPKKGDTLESIAKKHGMTLGQLKEVNGIAARSRTVPSLLVVPVNSTSAATMSKLPLMYAPPIPVGMRRVFYKVRKGDTQASIAKRFGVHPDDLKRWNPSSKFSPGTRIEVEVRAPAKRRTASAPAKKSQPAPQRRAASK
ncbi:MAG TPA: transglycosylase SLT domain-containing protein [Burkholderiales bacterium]